MNAIDALERGWSDGASLVSGLTVEDLAGPTACTGWDVRQLLDHTLGECQMMTEANRGQLSGDDSHDWVGDGAGLGATWARLGAENVASWRTAGLEDERAYAYGSFAGPVAAIINLGEVVVHSWDLARGIRADYEVDPELAALVHGLYSAFPLDGMRAGGMLAAEVPVPADARIADRMLGLLGRQP